MKRQYEAADHVSGLEWAALSGILGLFAGFVAGIVYLLIRLWRQWPA